MTIKVKQCNFVLLFSFCIKYLVSMSATSRPDDSNFISIKNAVSFADGLSMDMRKDNYRMYAIHKMQFKNQESFAKFYLLLSGDIELNPGPNPCMICSGSVNKRGLSEA